MGEGTGMGVGIAVKVAVTRGAPLLCVKVAVTVAVVSGVSDARGVADATMACVGATGVWVAGRGVAVMITVMGRSVARAVGDAATSAVNG